MSADHLSTDGCIRSQRKLREAIFGPVVEMRGCGDCVACCVHTQIDTPELQKAPGETCRHCVHGGCSIYTQRFDVCRSWQCLWKHIDTLPEEVRPDLSGFMIVLDQQEEPRNLFSRLFIRIMIIDAQQAQESLMLPAVLAMFQQGDLPVWIDDGRGCLTLVHPPEPVVQALLSRRGKPDNRLREEKYDDNGLSAEETVDIDCWRSGVRLPDEGRQSVVSIDIPVAAPRDGHPRTV